MNEAKKQPDTFHQVSDCVVCAATVPAWQDIATAPKDGTRVLVSGGTFARTDEIDKRPARTVIAFWLEEWQVWYGGYVSGGAEAWYWPSHWMPLPPAPGSQADTDSPRSDHPLRAALQAPGCERLLDFYRVGPAQRAAVEAFACALIDGVNPSRSEQGEKP